MSTEIKKARMKKRARSYFRSVFDIRSDTMSNDELHKMMDENTVIRGSNMWILMLAILIASIGLNVNSPAVIIGAMLISPLMSGILTMGYSLATSDLTMLRKAFTRFGTQVIISLITSTLYFLISPLDVATSEMIARTGPTLWDVLIALFGGIAGIIGNTRVKKGNVIPGVAIATALMPPLCTVGYGIATWQPRFIVGAFYLFAINTLFIMLSSALVTKILKIPVNKDVDEKKHRRMKRFITLITIVTVIPSAVFGAYTVYMTVSEQNINNYLRNEFVFTDTQMVQSSADMLGRTISVSLVGKTISDDVIERLEQELDRYNLKNYTLHITQNKLAETENSDMVTIAVQENTIQSLQAQNAEQQEKIDELENALASQIDCAKLAKNAPAIFTKLSDCGCGIISKDDSEYLLLTAAASSPLTPEEQSAVENWLKTESGIENVSVHIIEGKDHDR